MVQEVFTVVYCRVQTGRRIVYGAWLNDHVPVVIVGKSMILGLIVKLFETRHLTLVWVRVKTLGKRSSEVDVGILGVVLSHLNWTRGISRGIGVRSGVMRG